MARQFLDIPEAQDLALQALYIATTGASWTDNTGWGGATAADAFGVTVAGGVVTEIDLHANNLDGTMPDLTAINTLTGNCYFYSNSNLDGNVINLPTGANQYYLYNTAVSGDVADLPTGARWYHFGFAVGIYGDVADLPTGGDWYIFTNANVTGNITNLPAGAGQYYFANTDVAAGDISHLVSAASIRLSDNNWSTADVDLVINSIYSARASFTDATPELQIGGTNAAPTGIYQEGTQSTPAEKLYALVNDPNTESFNTWTATYSNKPVCGTGTTSGITASQATLNMPVSVPDGGSLTVTFYDASDDSVIDTDTVTGEGVATCTWPGRLSATSYTWYAIADDTATTTQSADITFTTGSKKSLFHLKLGLSL